MPALFHTMPRHLPLTPPEYLPYPNDMYGSQHFYGINNDSRYEIDRQRSYDARGGYDHGVATYAPARQENIYGSIGAPVLPPIRVPENMDLNHAVNNAQEPPKEEKVAGGVAANLDYKMDQMVDFVAETAQGIVQPNSSVSTSFRKYVSQILTSTRLPSSTIVLAMHYLSTRMTMLSSRGVYTSSTGHLFRMLTTSLMLASKFLDDNTFQNRSWAEVSHISVADLNKDELEWLDDIRWDLHIDSDDPQGFSGWLKQWKAYESKKNSMSLQTLKITPVDTSLRLQHSAPKYMPPTPIYTPTYSESVFSSRDHSPPHWNQWAPSRALSPPSANHSSPNTPNWYESHPGGYGQAPSLWSNTQPLRLPPVLSSHNSPSYYPSYGHQYGSTWGHGVSCGCGFCSSHHDHYGMKHSYGMQTVVG